LENIPYNDLFVLKPKREKKKIEGVGYMIQKIKNLESYYVLQKIIFGELDIPTIIYHWGIILKQCQS